MKVATLQHNTTFVVFVVLFLSCQRQQDSIPCLDVRRTYTQKEIFLTDIAEVRYLILNSDNEDYLYSGTIRATTENSVVVADAMSGDILFFSKEGVPKSRFNHRGNGPKEYRNALNVIFDEKKNEVFVSQSVGSRILAYSSTGEYQREIPLPQGTRMGSFASFDDDSFFFYDPTLESNRYGLDYDDIQSNDLISPFYLISKEDGRVLDNIALPMTPIFLGINHNGDRVPGFKTRLMKCPDGVLICNPESDTVFFYGKDRQIVPILHKIPLAKTTNPMTYINNCIDIGNYQFIELYIVQAGEVYPGIFPTKHYFRDKRTGEFFLQKLLLQDFIGKDFIIGPTSGVRIDIDNSTFVFELDLLELKEAYAQNRLDGKLKELVATLKEDDNNVFVLARIK